MIIVFVLLVLDLILVVKGIATLVVLLVIVLVNAREVLVKVDTCSIPLLVIVISVVINAKIVKQISIPVKMDVLMELENSVPIVLVLMELTALC